MAILSQPIPISYIHNCLPFSFDSTQPAWVTLKRDGVQFYSEEIAPVGDVVTANLSQLLIAEFTAWGKVVNNIVVQESECTITILTQEFADITFTAKSGVVGTGSGVSIIQQPFPYNFAYDCKDLILETELESIISFYQNNILILEEKYFPYNGKIEIKLSDMLTGLLSPTIQNSALFTQTTQFSTFKVVFPGGSITFKAIAGGRGTSEDPATFILNNLLTNRPQINVIDRKTPIILSYMRTAIAAITIKGYKPDGSISYHQHEMYYDQLFSVLYNYDSLLVALNVSQLVAVDFYVFIGDEPPFTYSNPIRFLFSRQSLPHDDVFLFENALGSMEAIVFEGLMEETQAHKSVSYKINEVTSEYRNDFSRSFKKNTGIFKNEAHRLWASEFFSSKKRYHKISDGTYKEIYVTSIDAKSVKLDMNDFSFDFSYSEDSRHREVSRINTLPAFVITPVLNNPGDTQDPGLPDT